MSPLIVIGFLAAAAMILWTAAIVAFEFKARPATAISYIVIAVAVGVAACWSTNWYDYFLNANTHVYGWPVPVIIFQRDSPTSAWEDFIGPTMFLGLPMNFIIFMLTPSLAFLTEATWRRWRFSLRTLLVAMTFLAIVLGLVVWLW